MRNRVSETARVLSLAGLLASAVSPVSSAAQGDAPSAERALLGRTAASFGVTEGAPRVLDGRRALLGRETEGAAPVVQPGRTVRTIGGRGFAVDGARALLGASDQSGASWAGRANATK